MSEHKNSQNNHNAVANKVTRLEPFTFAHYSVACERHPNRNEDTILIEKRRGMVGVFDGVGGSAAGEIASQTAARSILHGWRHELQHLQKGNRATGLLEDENSIDLCSVLEHLVKEADEQVRTEGAQKAGTDDLATTMAIAALVRHPGKLGYTLMYAHVGDSRIYLLRHNGPLQRLTSDDGLLAKLVENQVVSSDDALRIDQAMHSDQLTDTELGYFRLRGGITQALGGPFPPSIHISSISVYPGDRILLCTDGIHDNLIDEEIERILRVGPRPAVARLLVEKSIERSHQERDSTVRSKPDDMSAVVLTCRF